MALRTRVLLGLLSVGVRKEFFVRSCSGLRSISKTQMAMSAEVPKIKLNDGREMPAIALGTYLGFDEKGQVVAPSEEFVDVVAKSVEVGWTHIDTASVYKTEKWIGDGLKRQIDKGLVKRQDLFLTTKLWNTHHRRAEVASAMRSALTDLGMNYVDLYLMHWPIGLNEDYSDAADVDFMETWRGLEDCQRLGLTKSIGVSNFNKSQLVRVLTEGTIKPAVLQIEIHPQMVQLDMVAFAQSHDIAVMGYSPFGSMVSRYGMTFPGPKFDDPVFVRLSQKYNKTPAQVVLRWLIDRKIVPVPKTATVKRLEENLNVFDFSLEESEIEEINALNSNTRYTLPSFWQNHPYYPFEKIDNPVADPFKKAPEKTE